MARRTNEKDIDGFGEEREKEGDRWDEKVVWMEEEGENDGMESAYYDEIELTCIDFRYKMYWSRFDIFRSNSDPVQMSSV